MSEFTRIVEGSIGKDKYLTKIQIEQHQLQADEPISHDGKDLGPSPSELLLSALGSCTLITIRMYADRKEWDLESAEIELELTDKKAENAVLHSKISRKLKLNGNLDDSQKSRLLQIAGLCPVAKMITGQVDINDSLN